MGAGITGLFLCEELVRRGVEPVVFEAQSRPGGVIRSERVEGVVLELGPQRTRLTTGLDELVRRLELQGELLRAPAGLPLYVWRGGRLRRVPLTAGQGLRTDLLGPEAKLRALLEPLRPRFRRGESVEQCFVRRFGREAYVSLLGPLFGGIYASDPATMDAERALRPLLPRGGRVSLVLRLLRWYGAGSPLPAPCTFRDGMETLPRRLAERHAGRVHLDAPVSGIHREERGWRVVSPAGEATFGRVVLTVPAPEAANLLPAEAGETAGRVAALRYNRLAVAHLRSDSDLEGYGYQVAFGEPLRTRGVTWNASLFGRPGLFTAYLGGGRDPETAEWPDDRVAEVAAREFERVTGASADPIAVTRARIPAWDRSWRGFDPRALPAGLRIAANYVSRPGITSRLAEARELAERLASDRDG